jgi:hypothetical protein
MTARGTPYHRHSLLQQAHSDGLIVYHEDDSTDDSYALTTVDHRHLSLSAQEVEPFCAGLLAGFRAAAEESELDLALMPGEDPPGGHCKYCGAPLSSVQAARCTVCGKSQR